KAIQNTVWTNTAAFSTKANASVEVYNVNGQLVKSFEVNGNKNVNVSDLAAGVYVVKSTENGKTTTTKVVKK
ncbi:MAG TPA: T9SS type A sorting domain-containing protein, partial [Faecalibacter sp.]